MNIHKEAHGALSSFRKGLHAMPRGMGDVPLKCTLLCVEPKACLLHHGSGEELCVNVHRWTVRGARLLHNFDLVQIYVFDVHLFGSGFHYSCRRIDGWFLEKWRLSHQDLTFSLFIISQHMLLMPNCHYWWYINTQQWFYRAAATSWMSEYTGKWGYISTWECWAFCTLLISLAFTYYEGEEPLLLCHLLHGLFCRYFVICRP